MLIQIKGLHDVFVKWEKSRKVIFDSHYTNPTCNFIVIRLDILITEWKVFKLVIIKRINTARPCFSKTSLSKRE